MVSQGASPGQMAKSRSIDEPIFLGVVWAMLSISFASLLGRVLIKWRTFAKLSWDDLLVILAFLFTLATAVIMQVTSPYMYQLEYVRVGIIYPPPADFMSDTAKYFKGTVAMAVLFPCTLWSVKFAFLLFFWRLVSKIRTLKWHWYAVFTFTVLSFAGAFAATDWRCIASPVEVIFATCASRDSGVRMRFFMWFICAIDVFSDMLIMSIPFALLWQVKLPVRKRLSLAALFSLVCVTMAIAFVRASQITTYKGQPDNSRTTLWTFIEQSIAVIIVCLGSIRVLFTQEQNKASGRSYQYQNHHHYPRHSSGASSEKLKKKKDPYDIAITRTVDTEMTYAAPWRASDVESGKSSTIVSSKHCATCTCGSC